MNRKPVLAVVTAVAAFSAGIFLAIGYDDASRPVRGGKSVMKKAMASQGYSIKSQDDPVARMRQEWMMTRDPNTGSIPRNIRERELAYAQTLPSKEQGMFAKGGNTEAYVWARRGPHNVGGRTRAFAVDVTNTNILLAGGVSGGMWRSTDGGSTWTRTTSLSAHVQSVTCLAQDTRSGKTNIWYYGTGEYLGNSAGGYGSNSYYNGDGVFKSTDGGVTWSVLAGTSTNTPHVFDQFFDFVWNVATDPSNGAQDEVYAAVYGGIMRSTNGGTNWSGVLVNGGAPYSNYTDVQVTSTGVVYAAASWGGGAGSSIKGIWRSTDGTAWTNITPGTFPTQYERMVIGVAPSNQNVVYVLVQGANGNEGVNQINGHQLWKYTFIGGDGTGAGGTWVNRGVNLPNEAGVSGNAVFDTQNGYDMHVKVRPNDENFVIVGSTNLYRSTDGFATGSNWSRIGGYAGPSNYALYSNHHPDLHAAVFRPGSSTVFYSGHDGGVSVTNDIGATTVSWTLLNNGYYTGQYYTIALDKAGTTNTVLGGLQDNGTWYTTQTSATTPWGDLLGGDGSYAAVKDGGSVTYFSAQNGIIFKQNMTNASWTRIDPTGASGYLFINPFILDPANQAIMYLAGGSTVWRNSNIEGIAFNANQNTISTNWTNMTNTTGHGGTISALAASTSPANVLYYGTSNGKVYVVTGANSGNPTPTDVFTGKGFPADSYVACIAVDPRDANHALAVFSNYAVVSIFSTANGGSTWTAVSGNLEQNTNGSGNGPSVRWAYIHPVSGGTVYFAGTSTGMYSTTSFNGTSTVWSQEGTSVIGRNVVSMVDGRTSDGLVTVATHGNGVYAAAVVTSVDGRPGVPRAFMLEQNYPNPFNPSTVIRYSIDRRSNVRMRLYDVNGRAVTTLVDRYHEAGAYDVSWDGRTAMGERASSGVYYYRLEAGSEVHTRAMVLAR